MFLFVTAIIAICVSALIFYTINLPQFGKLPSGDRLKRIKITPYYHNGQFHNAVATPLFTNNANIFSVILEGFRNRDKDLRPHENIPVIKNDLKSLRKKDKVIWLGHSSWFIQAGGKNILIDPVLSDNAAPFSSMNKAFDGTNLYTADDIPEIDYLLISHDHWDHLDYKTVRSLMPKVKYVVCPLGVGAYFEQWGYKKEKILESGWNSKVSKEDGISIYVLPARHYSGRLFSKNKTLWASFALETPDIKIFYSGDSGYGPHFKQIGMMFGGFDIAMLDCGQYDKNWAFIHMTPEEAVKAADDLNTSALIPSHIGRFSLANHSWYAPFNEISAASDKKQFKLMLPLIGESVPVPNDNRAYIHWWQSIK